MQDELRQSPLPEFFFGATIGNFIDIDAETSSRNTARRREDRLISGDPKFRTWNVEEATAGSMPASGKRRPANGASNMTNGSSATSCPVSR